MLDYQRHEKYVSDLLDLDLTVASGSTYRDPGDAVSREHYRNLKYRLYAEAKSTANKSFAIKRDMIAQYVRRAAEYGKMFCLPIRFIHEDKTTDYVLLRLLDFSDILSSAQRSREHVEAWNYLNKIVAKINDPRIRGEAQKALDTLLGD